MQIGNSMNIIHIIYIDDNPDNKDYMNWEGLCYAIKQYSCYDKIYVTYKNENDIMVSKEVGNNFGKEVLKCMTMQMQIVNKERTISAESESKIYDMYATVIRDCLIDL